MVNDVRGIWRPTNNEPKCILGRIESSNSHSLERAIDIFHDTIYTMYQLKSEDKMQTYLRG